MNSYCMSAQYVPDNHIRFCTIELFSHAKPKKVAPVRLLCLQLFLYQDPRIEAYTSQRTIALHWCVLDTIVINFLFFFIQNQ